MTYVVKHSIGELDPDSLLGFATITEYVVLDVLGDATKEKFGAPYDLLSESLGKINVKYSILHRDSPTHRYWTFAKTPTAQIPDYYICLGMDEYQTEIIKVWKIPGSSVVVNKRGIIVRHSRDERVKKYEQDSTIYNKTLQEMNINEKPEFRNTTKPKINDTRLTLQKMELEYRELLESVKNAPPSTNNIMLECIDKSAPLQKLVLLSIVKIAQKHKLPLEYVLISSYCLNLAEKYNYSYVSFRRVADSIGTWGTCGVIKVKYPKIKAINGDYKEIEELILRDPEFAKVKAGEL